MLLFIQQTIGRDGLHTYCDILSLRHFATAALHHLQAIRSICRHLPLQRFPLCHWPIEEDNHTARR